MKLAFKTKDGQYFDDEELVRKYLMRKFRLAVDYAYKITDDDDMIRSLDTLDAIFMDAVQITD